MCLPITLQVCFSVAVNISHQLKQTVVYIDTKGGMCANRLLQMLQTKTPNLEEQVIKEEFISNCYFFLFKYVKGAVSQRVND